MNSRYLTAREAAERLNIKPATLYAYVSRGLIRSEEGETTSRDRRYLAEDVEALVRRRANRRDPAKTAREALHWGTPVLDSALTLIENGRLYYRGHDAARLARDYQFEEVAALLWLDDFAAASALFAPPNPLPHPPVIDPDLPPVAALQIALATAAVSDLNAYTLTPDSVAHTGARILHLMTAVLTGQPPIPPAAGIAAALAAHWTPAEVANTVPLLNAALILCADHELNASSFTARVVAGVDANPYAVVLAGLSALQGYKHGKNTERVGALVREVGEARYARTVIAERLQRGERIPGFGHWLYPDLDPRAAALLALLRETSDHAAPAMDLIDTLEHEVVALTGKQPNVDFALVALETGLRLPRGAALLLFALGRTVGWLAHAAEQYASATMIRPRARYTGPRPPADR